MDQEKLRQLSEFAQKCNAFANLCQERVMLLDAYKADADAQIKAQAEETVILKDALQSERNKKGWIFPLISVILGGVLGGILF